MLGLLVTQKTQQIDKSYESRCRPAEENQAHLSVVVRRSLLAADKCPHLTSSRPRTADSNLGDPHRREPAERADRQTSFSI
jgi:hypothetical protein